MTDDTDTKQPGMSGCPGCPLCTRPPSTIALGGECTGCAVCDPSKVELGNVTAQAPQQRVGVSTPPGWLQFGPQASRLSARQQRKQRTALATMDVG